MKTQFQLETYDKKKTMNFIRIIGKEPENKPYLFIETKLNAADTFVADKDLETLAVNILKAIKSKRLNPSNQK